MQRPSSPSPAFPVLHKQEPSQTHLQIHLMGKVLNPIEAINTTRAALKNKCENAVLLCEMNAQTQLQSAHINLSITHLGCQLLLVILMQVRQAAGMVCW